ncbi:MAG: hypothetical protein ACRDGB_10720 [Candidatus Limnocylindria bacterium]
MLLQHFDLVAAVASVLGFAGVSWLAPLMFDQVVFFGDQEQNRQAAAAREAMLPAAALLLVASGILVVRWRPWHALFTALPALVAVPLALLVPGAAYQLLAYGISAPFALGALVSAAVPLPRQLPTPILTIGVLILLAFAVVTTPFIGLLVIIAAVAWWRLPHPRARP